MPPRGPWELLRHPARWDEKPVPRGRPRPKSRLPGGTGGDDLVPSSSRCGLYPPQPAIDSVVVTRGFRAEAVPLHGSLRCGKPGFVRAVFAVAADIEFKPPIGVVVVSLVLAGIDDGSESDASINGSVHVKAPRLNIAVG